MVRTRRGVIVVVSHLCPFPTIHGNRSRFVALLTWLKNQGFQLSYILQPVDVDGPDGVRRLRELVDRLEVVPPPREEGRIKEFLRRAGRRVEMKLRPGQLGRWLLDHPFKWVHASDGDGHIDQWCWAATRKAVQREVKAVRPIAVMSEYALLSRSLENVPASTLKIIDTVEVFFRNRERFSVEGLAAPFVCTPESEQVALNRADVLIAIQKNDAHVLRSLFPEKRVITVSHTYQQCTEIMTRTGMATILCVGSSNPYNSHGLRQFLDHAWPMIGRRVPDVTLRVVGGVSGVETADDASVIHVGRVDDDGLAREYQMAHVVINPQVAGTGLKIKCVEALTAGCPLVMNRAGADGLEEGEGSAFLVAKDWPEFGDHVVRILTDEAFRRELEMRARRFAERMFSADVTFSELELILTEHMSLLARQDASPTRDLL